MLSQNVISCNLQLNELPLRHLITKLDKKIFSNNKWYDSMGKMHDKLPGIEGDTKVKDVEISTLSSLKLRLFKNLPLDKNFDSI